VRGGWEWKARSHAGGAFFFFGGARGNRVGGMAVRCKGGLGTGIDGIGYSRRGGVVRGRGRIRIRGAVIGIGAIEVCGVVIRVRAIVRVGVVVGIIFGVVGEGGGAQGGLLGGLFGGEGFEVERALGAAGDDEVHRYGGGRNRNVEALQAGDITIGGVGEGEVAGGGGGGGRGRGF
jgi:hypothetical protein